MKILTGTLYDPAFEHDACGVGFVADVHGRAGKEILPLALSALERMAHRGAVDADGKTGDGAGVTTQIPYAVLEPELERMGMPLASPNDLAVGLLFLPSDPDRSRSCKKIAAETLVRQGLRFLGWRAVPIDETVLGEKARRSRPVISHLLVGRPFGLSHDEFERRLFLARKEMEGRLRSLSIDEFYVASLSHRTLVYKALIRGVDLARFYCDLKHPEFSTSFSLFHQRYSTNTFPCWGLTHPFRFLAHNGEINTIQGNRNWMKAREAELESSLLQTGSSWLRPLIQEGMSDSASLDNALELLTMAGREASHSMAMLMPPAWENDVELAPEVRAFFEYHSCLTEPWDGPATVVFTDGRVVGAALDRNGLRPARYLVTKDGLVVVSSEVGVVDVPAERILRKGRLGPGDIVAVDLKSRKFLDRQEIHSGLAARNDYREWLEARRMTGMSQESSPVRLSPDCDIKIQRSLGYTREELELILGPMFREGLEPLGSMGDDTPLAVLSSKPRLLFSYFKQRFAQVTNPPIDPIREALVMSLTTHLGPCLNLAAETPQHAAQLHLSSPLLRNEELRDLAVWEMEGWTSRTLSLLFRADGGSRAFKKALDNLLLQAARAVEDGAAILILSDRGIDAGHAAIPILLAVSAVHHHLLRQGLRLRTSLVAETGEARDDHQVSMLFGFGASAVNPYLVLEIIGGAVLESGASEREADEAVARYLKSLSKGILKIMSKMGISTLRSYQGAQLFEALGIGTELIQDHFTGTPSQIGGVGLDEIALEVLARHTLAYGPEALSQLEDGGFHRYRKGGEVHAFAPQVIKTLHALVASGEPLRYEAYAELVHQRDPIVPRDLLEFVKGEPVPLNEVEPVEKIFPRFMTAAMSLGALSPEAHEVLAIAMNRIGGRSNSGEGGEDPARYWEVGKNGDSANSRIKQVASARFGVTAEYVMSAHELQIKMAQGSKPGEGGQLPGHKVAPHIARLRHSSPGITLISPPPHHDIYSIEDLAQLIYDLKRVNPRAKVNVKLVSEVGIGTIAAGVAKAFADVILISGHDGGTGASPRGSIKHAGTPWELGLAETQQVLVMSGLRDRVRLQADGGFKTGRDVVMAALLGAEEYGFGSAAVVAAGCVMARQCHLNTCPVGIATQREDLRKKFTGTPEMVISFLAAVANEIRQILALLGYRTLGEIIGRTELLSVRMPPARFKVSTVALDRVLAGARLNGQPRQCRVARNDPPVGEGHLDDRVLEALRLEEDGPVPLEMDLEIRNSDRAVGARIGGHLAYRYRDRKLSPGTVKLNYTGTAGQSFGAFCVDGIQMVLRGEANDYVGKSMSGGEIIVSPPAALNDSSHDHIIAGNTILYGATGGRLFLGGRVGERFAVRNSGALAVVEGTGDHACEYMTSGVVAILGETGRNFGAGMSGGAAYVFDPEGIFQRRYNPELITLEANLPTKDQELLRQMIAWHYKGTGSARAREILDRWEELLPLFWMVVPKDATQLKAPRSQPASAPVRRVVPVLRTASVRASGIA
jgi:glutamate synthase (ferredoxin)